MLPRPGPAPQGSPAAADEGGISSLWPSLLDSLLTQHVRDEEGRSNIKKLVDVIVQARPRAASPARPLRLLSAR